METPNKPEKGQLYWQQIGYKAHEFGLELLTSDKEVLRHELSLREKKVEGRCPNWFVLFCRELKAGIDPEVPRYCDCDDEELENDPRRAYILAHHAKQVFLDDQQ